MRSKLLKAASIVSLIFAAGHTFGTLQVAFGDAKTQMVQQTVIVEGYEKTFAGLFLGYGYLITVLLVMQGLILWLLSRQNSQPNREIIGLIALASIGNAIISAMYLIFIPVIFLSVIALLVASAWFIHNNK